LLEDHESKLIAEKNKTWLANKMKADGISDYITGLMEQHEKIA
jgi:starvation-inducible DNA-binding protein